MLAFLALALTPILVGIALGYLAGGRLSVLVGQFHHLWLLWLAVSVQVLQTASSDIRRAVEAALHVPMLMVVSAVGVFWLVLNVCRWSPGMRLAGLLVLAGGFANAAAVGVNGRMPYSIAAAKIIGLAPDSTTPKNQPASGDSPVMFLADVIPLPWLHKVVSVGDCLILTGSTLLVITAMRAKKVNRATGSGTPAPGGVHDLDPGDAPVHDRSALGGQLNRATSVKPWTDAEPSALLASRRRRVRRPGQAAADMSLTFGVLHIGPSTTSHGLPSRGWATQPPTRPTGR